MNSSQMNAESTASNPKYAPTCGFSKDKGTETTYWLTGETGEDYNLPTPPTT